MKRIVCLIIFTFLCFALVACGGNTKDPADKGNDDEKVANAADLKKKEAEAAVNAVFEAIENALVAGDKVQIIGFGTFEVKAKAAREGRNPKTGEAIEIEASNQIKFSAGKVLKNKVNA